VNTIALPAPPSKESPIMGEEALKADGLVLTEPADIEWLAQQLLEYPNRVDENRTCAIGQLHKLAAATLLALTPLIGLLAYQMGKLAEIWAKKP
jgi:hypothetical protein